MALDPASKDEIRHFVVTQLQTNCYAYISAGECMVVDPGGSGKAIAQELTDVDVTLIVATHGHGDHVGGVKALKEATGAAWCISAADMPLASRAGQVSEQGRSYDDDAPMPDRTLLEGDVLDVGTAHFTVIAAPGHTPGGIVLLGAGSAAGIAFVGDTIFAGSCGRTDFAEGDPSAMKRTLARLSREIPPSTTLLCGHGPATAMAQELTSNPFLR